MLLSSNYNNELCSKYQFTSSRWLKSLNQIFIVFLITIVLSLAYSIYIDRDKGLTSVLLLAPAMASPLFL